MVIGLQGGRKAELGLATIRAKSTSVTATGLRGRPVSGRANEAGLVVSVVHNVWPILADGRVRPIIHRRLPASQAAEAHQLLDSKG